jgi:hypothetical protein
MNTDRLIELENRVVDLQNEVRLLHLALLAIGVQRPASTSVVPQSVCGPASWPTS